MIPFILAAIGGYLIGDSINPQKFEGGGLIAPNGKPTNLTPEQYKLVRTPEFKAWFGDWENSPETASKIVDENGEPLVLHHGTRGRFNIFDIEKSGQSNTIAKVGFWFTPKSSFAYNFADNSWWGESDAFVYSVFLSIKNPKVYVSEDIRYGDSYEKFKTDVYEIAGQDADDANIGGLGMMLNNSKETIKKYRELLTSQGFDGVIIKNTKFDRGEAGGYNDQYVALEPNQIKLANGINRTFDNSNPDIRYKEGGKVKKVKFDIDDDDEGERITISIKGIGKVILLTTYPEYEFIEDIDEDTLSELGIEEGDMIGKIEHIQINDEYKGQGYAKLLMNKAIEVAEENGLMPLYLNASPMGNKGLNINDLTSFYESFGFEVFLEQGNNNLMIYKPQKYEEGGLVGYE